MDVCIRMPNQSYHNTIWVSTISGQQSAISPPPHAFFVFLHTSHFVPSHFSAVTPLPTICMSWRAVASNSLLKTACEVKFGSWSRSVCTSRRAAVIKAPVAYEVGKVKFGGSQLVECQKYVRVPGCISRLLRFRIHLLFAPWRRGVHEPHPIVRPEDLQLRCSRIDVDLGPPRRPRNWCNCDSPKTLGVFETIMTVALGTSTPTSMTVVVTSAFSSPRLKADIVVSFSSCFRRP